MISQCDWLVGDIVRLEMSGILKRYVILYVGQDTEADLLCFEAKDDGVPRRDFKPYRVDAQARSCFVFEDRPVDGRRNQR